MGSGTEGTLYRSSLSAASVLHNLFCRQCDERVVPLRKGKGRKVGKEVKNGVCVGAQRV